jgi:hypothetical protein
LLIDIPLLLSSRTIVLLQFEELLQDLLIIDFVIVEMLLNLLLQGKFILCIEWLLSLEVCLMFIPIQYSVAGEGGFR